MKNHSLPSEDSPSPAVLDRVMTYLRQLKLDPRESLQMALRATEKTGAAHMGQTIETLIALLEERGPNPEEAEGLARAALVVPPLKRRSMVSEEMNISIADALARMFTGGFRPAKKNGSRLKGGDEQ